MTHNTNTAGGFVEAYEAQHGSSKRPAPKMTRAHFELIAAASYSLAPDPDGESAAFDYLERERIASAFVQRLTPTNPNFDRERFIRAAVHGSK